MPDAAKPALQPHPQIAALVQAGQQAQATTKFAGYVGPSKAGIIRLYSTLDDLTHYIEFDEAAVVQSAAAPDDLLPNNAVAVWVKSDAPVLWIREYTSASALAAALARNVGQASGAGSGSTSGGS